MSLTGTQTFIMILAVALGAAITRFAPFWLFPESKAPSEHVLYLGRVLPAAMMGLLVVYCLRNVQPLQPPCAIPELLAVAAIVVVHKWKGNMFLSIGVSTVLYMVLVQVVFR